MLKAKLYPSSRFSGNFKFIPCGKQTFNFAPPYDGMQAVVRFIDTETRSWLPSLYDLSSTGRGSVSSPESIHPTNFPLKLLPGSQASCFRKMKAIFRSHTVRRLGKDIQYRRQTKILSQFIPLSDITLQCLNLPTEVNVQPPWRGGSTDFRALSSHLERLLSSCHPHFVLSHDLLLLSASAVGT